MIRNRLREWRRLRNMSQAELGDVLGVHWQTIHRLETGLSKLDLPWIERLAEVLRIDPLALIDDGFRTVAIAGIAEASAWRPDWRFPAAGEPPPPLIYHADPLDQAPAIAGVELRGDSMARRYPDRSILFFRRPHAGETFLAGKRYLVERSDPERALVEASARLAWSDQNGELFLILESDNPQHRIPLRPSSESNLTMIGPIVHCIIRES